MAVVKRMKELEKLLDLRKWRMMPPPGPQMYLWPRVTLTFDLLAPKVDSFIPLSRGPVRMKKNRFIHFPTITFTNKVTDERTDKRTA